MTTVKFSDLPCGAEFFDPYSGEDFVKVCANAANMKDHERMGVACSLCTFDADEEVSIEDKAAS